MDINEWKAAYFKELSETDWNKAYYMQTGKSEREALLKQRVATGEESEELELIFKLFDHRYTPVGKEPAHIDHAIRGLINMNFLPETKKSILKRKHFQKELDSILSDIGFHVAEPYGDAGQTIMYDEMCNIVRAFIHICQDDKQYNAVLFGFGRIKPERQSWKVARNLAQIAVGVPLSTGTVIEFQMLTAAARQVFGEEYPKTSDDYDNAVIMVKNSIK